MCRFWLTIGLSVLYLALPAPQALGQTLADRIDSALVFAGNQLLSTAGSGMLGTEYPLSATPGAVWLTKTQSDWISGLFPGLLWTMYQLTGDATYVPYAQSWAAAVQPGTNNNHFRTFAAWRPWYQYNADPTAYQKMQSAASLQEAVYVPLPDSSGHNLGVRGLFSDASAWRPDSGAYPSSRYATGYVDGLMDLTDLLWIARQTSNTTLRQKVLTHARTATDVLNRSSGGTHHWCYIRLTTGASRTTAYQNYNDTTTWARGQAWAIYAMTEIARDACQRGDDAVKTEFLAKAQTAVNYWLNHPNLPTDGVPLWDFDVPSYISSSHWNRDSSAAAVTCSALIDLSQLVDAAADKSRYMTAAQQILTSLTTSKSQGGYLNSLADGTPDGSGILAHGVYNHSYCYANGNSGLPGQGILDDGQVIWGDYFFLEAIERYLYVTGPAGRTSGLAWQNMPAPIQRGQFSVDFDAVPAAAGMSGITGLSAGRAYSAPFLAVTVRFNPSGYIDVYNGTNYSADVAVPYAAGVSYHFHLDVDIAAHQYTAHVTPAGGTRMRLTTGAAFGSQQAGAIYLDNWAVQADSGSHQVSNFVISPFVAPVLADIDGDGHVNLADLKLLVAAWNTTPSSGSWNPDADLDSDNAVTLSDLKILVAHWNT